MADIEYGYCHCGCGGKTTVVAETNQGTKKGEPRQFIQGHFTRVMYGTIEERLWSNIDIRGPNECWLWTGHFSTTGYGMISYLGHPKKSHRLVYTLTHGPIPKGLLIRHSCDCRACNNPAHLLVGTVADNSRDMVERGRSSHVVRTQGETSGKAKANNEIVKRIRELYALGYGPTRIKREMNLDLHIRTIRMIAKRKAWKHLP